MVTVAYCSSWINGVCMDEGRDSLGQETSSESLKRLIQRIPNIVLGAHTYRFLQREQVDLSKSRFVILTRESITDLPEVGILAATAPDALAHFPNVSDPTILVAAEPDNIEAFLVLGLVNELIVDIEPGLTVAPRAMFPNLSKSIKLEIVGMRKVGAATIQLHYKISS